MPQSIWMFLPSIDSAFPALHLHAEGVFPLLKASTVAPLEEISQEKHGGHIWALKAHECCGSRIGLLWLGRGGLSS